MAAREGISDKDGRWKLKGAKDGYVEDSFDKRLKFLRPLVCKLYFVNFFP